MKPPLANKLRICAGVKRYGNPKAFETYERPYGAHIVDNRPDKHRTPERHGVVMTFPTLGGGMATYQCQKEAVRLARKVVRMLNAGV